MAWKKRIEKWRPFVSWECKDIPPDLVLAVIRNESNGVAGLPAGVASKSKDYLPTASGGEHYVDRAYGLMQTVPATVLGYNQHEQSKPNFDPVTLATWEDISGTDERAARIQIRAGCYYLALANHLIHKAHPEAAPAASLSEAKPDQIRIVLTAYAVGAGATIKKLDQLKAEGKAATFSNLAASFPNWGGKSNRPIYYANKVSGYYEENKTGSYTGSKPGGLLARIGGKNGTGFVILPIIAGLAFAYWRKP
jgi:soluble lytic murein transglycosylase-like protein